MNWYNIQVGDLVFDKITRSFGLVVEQQPGDWWIIEWDNGERHRNTGYFTEPLVKAAKNLKRKARKDNDSSTW